MKRILYLASFDINKRAGGCLASLCYYNSLCAIRPGRVDLMMGEEACVGKYKDAIKIPARKGLDYLTDISLHRGKRFITDYIRKNAGLYDICVINCSRYGGDMMKDIKKAGLKIVMIHHNYEVEFCMDNKYLITLNGRFPQLVAYYERRAYKMADANCYLTKADADLIRDAYGVCKGSNHILGVYEYEPQSYKPSSTVNNHNFVISGSLSDYQTYHSLELFEKEYFETLKEICPDLKLIITGRNPNSSIYSFQSKNPDCIEIVPNPDNIEYVIERATVFLCPTSIGGGLKLRVMDGLKKGLPVLVHKISARGYDIFEGCPYFQVYSNKNEFAKGLKAIFNYIHDNRNYKEEIIKKYNEYFGFEAGLNRMERIIESLS